MLEEKDLKVQEKFKPLLGKVVIKKDEVQERSRGGIIIPEMAKNPPKTGYVIACSAGRVDAGTILPCEVKVGQKIMYMAHAMGVEIEIDDVKYFLMSEGDIIGILLV